MQQNFVENQYNRVVSGKDEFINNKPSYYGESRTV